VPVSRHGRPAEPAPIRPLAGEGVARRGHLSGVVTGVIDELRLAQRLLAQLRAVDNNAVVLAVFCLVLMDDPERRSSPGAFGAELML
jgi:hypothetical protein